MLLLRCCGDGAEMGWYNLLLAAGAAESIESVEAAGEGAFDPKRHQIRAGAPGP